VTVAAETRASRWSSASGCLTAGWLGLAGLARAATSLDAGAGWFFILVGGPLGGFGVWSHGSGADDSPGADPPPGDNGDPPEWDWERFERDLSDYVARRAALGR